MKNLLQHTRRTLQQNHCPSLFLCFCVSVSVPLSHAPCSLFFSSSLSLSLIFFPLCSFPFFPLFSFCLPLTAMWSYPSRCLLPSARSLARLICVAVQRRGCTRDATRVHSLSSFCFLCRSLEKSLTSQSTLSES